MVKGVYPQPRIVRAGDEGIAGPKTRAQHAELLIALRLQPVEAAADIDDRLPAGCDRAPDIRADRVIGALQLSRTANVMVRLPPPQRRDTESVEERAQRIVAEGIGVPLRHHDDRLLRLADLLLRRGALP